MPDTEVKYLPSLIRYRDFFHSNEKRVVFKQLQNGSYADQYEETFFWLSDSMISNELFLCNDPNVGLSLNETEGLCQVLHGGHRFALKSRF